MFCLCRCWQHPMLCDFRPTYAERLLCPTTRGKNEMLLWKTSHHEHVQIKKEPGQVLLQVCQAPMRPLSMGWWISSKQGQNLARRGSKSLVGTPLPSTHHTRPASTWIEVAQSWFEPVYQVQPRPTTPRELTPKISWPVPVWRIHPQRTFVPGTKRFASSIYNRQRIKKKFIQFQTWKGVSTNFASFWI